MNLTPFVGYIAAFCTTFAFIPQAVKTIKTRHTEDLSLGMYSLITFGIIMWLIYGILLKDFPIIIANAVTLLFTATILFIIVSNTIKQKKTS